MRTIVILHGWGHSSEAWRGAFPNADFNVVALDLPGFGAEPLINPDWGVPEYADWVRQKIESAKLEDVVVLGHSFGGRVAAQLASEKPAWLAALVLYAAPCLYRPRAMVRLKRSLAPIAHVLGLRGMYHGNPELTVADKIGLGRIYRRVVDFDQAETLRQITAPTLLVWGQNDADVPLTIAREMEELIPHSRLEVLPGLGHNAHLENPNLFFGVVKKYVQTF